MSKTIIYKCDLCKRTSDAELQKQGREVIGLSFRGYTTIRNHIEITKKDLSAKHLCSDCVRNIGAIDPGEPKNQSYRNVMEASDVARNLRNISSKLINIKEMAICTDARQGLTSAQADLLALAREIDDGL